MPPPARSRLVCAEIDFFTLSEALMMTWRNLAAWTELEIPQDALHCKLQLLNQFIEIQHRHGMISGAVAESLLTGIESALVDSETLAAIMHRLTGAAVHADGVSA